MNKRGDIKTVVGILLILICVLTIILFYTGAFGKIKSSLVNLFGSEDVLNREQVNAESKSVLNDIESSYSKCKALTKNNCACEGNYILAGLYEKYNLIFDVSKVSLVDAEHNDMNIDHKDIGVNCYLIYNEEGGKYIPKIEEFTKPLTISKADVYEGKPLLYRMNDGKICLILKDKFSQYKITRVTINRLPKVYDKETLLFSYLDSASCFEFGGSGKTGGGASGSW